MSLELNMLPMDAWQTYLANSVDTPGWLESSQNLSRTVGLSKRELLGLILYSYRLDEGGTIPVCWNREDPEPNDGFLSLPENVIIRCEHKIIPQLNTTEILDSMTETYERYAALGAGYGSDIHLIIHINRQTIGLVRVSSLHDAIGNDCYFEKVLLASVNGFEGEDIIRFGLGEHYPALDVRHIRINKHTGALVNY